MKIKRFKTSLYVVFALILIFFIISFALWAFSFPGIRKTFIFYSNSASIEYIESRYIKKNRQKPLINCYIEELLLGPLNELSAPLFPRGTKLDSCFLRDSVLYVELSEELLNALPASSYDYEKSFALFKKNIFRSFSNVKSIKIYINGSEGLLESFQHTENIGKKS